MSDASRPEARVAVVIPCLNEAAAIGGVVRAFQAALPDAAIHVFDNASTDETGARARAAGALVHRVPLRGKGHVVRRMFADVEADLYVLVDGDGTYDAAASPLMIETLRANGLDMVNAARVHAATEAYRPGHVLGNRMLSGMVAMLFGDRLDDLLSGYRVFSRRFVKSFPAASSGFEIETELTVHALSLSMPLGELETAYGARLEGSESKLRTFRDGARIARTIMLLLERERPLTFFGGIALVLLASALGLALPLLPVWIATGLVPRLPTAMLATGLVVLCSLSVVCGLLLDSVTRSRREARHLVYLQMAGPTQARAADAPRAASDDRTRADVAAE